jgi:uncharacterized delta-60 repeat protein
VKRYLLAMAIFACPVFAQDEVALSSAFAGGEGVNGEVLAIALQPDGKIIIGGRFTTVNGIARNNIARLNDDGTLDRTFAEGPALGTDGQVNALAIQPEGGIVVGGTFSQAGQFETRNLARYQAEGSVDRAFGGEGTVERGADGTVYALAVQPDGKILVGGDFNVIFGQTRRGVARLNADGTLDAQVTAESALSGTVKAVVAEPGGSTVAGGEFTLPIQDARNLSKLLWQ